MYFQIFNYFNFSDHCIFLLDISVSGSFYIKICDIFFSVFDRSFSLIFLIHLSVATISIEIDTRERKKKLFWNATDDPIWLQIFIIIKRRQVNEISIKFTTASIYINALDFSVEKKLMMMFAKVNLERALIVWVFEPS